MSLALLAAPTPVAILDHAAVRPSDPLLRELARRVLSAEDDLRAGQLVAAQGALQAARSVLASYVDFSALAEPVRGGLPPFLKERLRRHIEANLAQPITVESLAEMARLSASHFGRVFRQSFGTPPQAYVALRRAERAKHLLQNSDEPIAQIAIACGLVDQAALCKLFRRYVGQSPAAWRRMQAA